MRQHWKPGNYQRAGNTKTHGMVRGQVTIRDDLPSAFRCGVFAEPKTSHGQKTRTQAIWMKNVYLRVASVNGLG